MSVSANVSGMIKTLSSTSVPGLTELR
jgi:hypothetical protein